MSPPDHAPDPSAEHDPIQAAREEVARRDVIPAERADVDAPGEQAGDWIDRYKLLQQIGEGGFGVVWMAEQSVPVRRKVALKVIKLGMDTRQVVARFEAERQALALMDHPHIAKVLDGGATALGRPYFVMELVNGVPIVQYCDEHNLTIDERLELMAQVCHAVQHAHNKGLIHRDLKPSNLLVGVQDGRPQVKVIDFGIAKATSQTLTERTLFTEHRQVIGTLQYMSPEQAEGSLDIDTRTDIYSLGILLYELLTGSTPFDVATLRDALYGEIQRLIREVDPPKPSTRLSQSADALASIAAHRRVEPRRLGVLLRGELDWIVMKALEKDRARRYETANGLALDLQRYLSGEAVLAAPPSAAYRLRKLARRHRVAAATSAAVAAALLAGVIAFAWQAGEARAQRDRAIDAEREALANEQAAQAARAVAEGNARLALEQRQRAETAEAEAETRADALQLVADFQAGMLAQLDPAEAGRLLSADVSARHAAALAKASLPEDERDARLEAFRDEWNLVSTTDAARELIERAILRPAIAAIDARFQDQPLVDAQLRQVLAGLYRHLGLYDPALPLQLRALQTRRSLLGEEHPETLVSMDQVGLLLHARGEHAEAEPYFRQALESSRRVLGDEHEDTLDRVSNLGTVLEAQGELVEAEPYYREALEASRRVRGDDDAGTLTALNNMGYLLESQGELSEAEASYREALEGCRRALGEDHPFTLAATNNLGALLHRLGRLDEAEPLYRAALEGHRRALGEEHPDTLISLNNLGVLLKFQGRRVEAAALYREVLDARRRVLGADHPDTLISLNNLGALLWADGRLGEAEPCYREAVAAKRRTLGAEHASTLHSIVALGGLLEERGRYAEAATLLVESEAAARATFTGGNAHELARLLLNLGKARAGAGELADAESLLLEAHDLYVECPGPTPKDRRDSVQALVDLYSAWERVAPGEGHDARSAEWKAEL